MSTIVGGLRDRMIYLNFLNMLEDSLTSLGWFSGSNTLLTAPLEIVDTPILPSVPVVPNKVSVVVEDTYTEEAEMGSNLENVRWNYFVEIFAEDDAVGKHLSGDIRDILKGKFPSIGRSFSNLAVYSNDATPELMFYCAIEDVESQRTLSFDDSIRQHWWTVACVVEDRYGDEDDG